MNIGIGIEVELTDGAAANVFLFIIDIDLCRPKGRQHFTPEQHKL